MQAARNHSPRQWHNHLPGWIVSHPNYAELPQGPRRTLQTIADSCDSPDSAGSLRAAVGGQRLAIRAGCSVRTLFRHILRLEGPGFIVCVALGLVFDGRMFPNQYAVPGVHGALDSVRWRRRVQIMRDGKPVVLEPGVQLELALKSTAPPGQVSSKDDRVYKRRTDASSTGPVVFF